MVWFRAFWLVVLIWGLSFCSYHLRKDSVKLGGTAAASENRRLFLPVFDNLTVKTGFEGIVTSALRKALSQVSGLEIVSSPEDADLHLLGSILQYDLQNRSFRQGDATSEAAGGLLAGQSTVNDFTLTLEIRFQLIEKEIGPQPKREIWTRVFGASGVFDASTRLDEGGDSLSSGSASAPLINDARERLQVKQLAENIAEKVLEQIVQDF